MCWQFPELAGELGLVVLGAPPPGGHQVHVVTTEVHHLASLPLSSPDRLSQLLHAASLEDGYGGPLVQDVLDLGDECWSMMHGQASMVTFLILGACGGQAALLTQLLLDDAPFPAFGESSHDGGLCDVALLVDSLIISCEWV